MDEKGLGKRLGEVRRKAGMSQQQMAQAANLSFSTLTKIERGAIKAPSIFTIQRIAGALNISLDDLLGLRQPTRHLAKSKSGVSFVYFDVNGCLVRFYQRASQRVAEDHNIAPELVEMAYLHFNDEICRGTITMDDFNASVAHRLGLKELDWAKYYLEAAEPLLAMHKTLSWAAKHYRIGLMTNMMPGMLAELFKLGKVPSLAYDVIVDSSTVGTIKPEPQIYKYAVEQANVPVDEILLVDDTQMNLVAAEKAGWRVVWFDYARPEESASHIYEVLEVA